MGTPYPGEVRGPWDDYGPSPSPVPAAPRQGGGIVVRPGPTAPQPSPQTATQRALDEARLEDARRKASAQQASGGVDIGAEQGRVAGFYGRAREANENYGSIGAGPRSLMGQWSQDNIPNIDNEYFIDDKSRQAKVWQDDFIAATLRYESGAAVPPDELEKQRRRYFPMPGDDEGTMAAKAQSRANAIAGLQVAGGPVSPVVDDRLNAGGTALEGAAGDGFQRAAANERVAFGDERQPLQSRQYTQEQGSQIEGLLRAGRLDDAIQLSRDFGIPLDPASTRRTMEALRRNPNAAFPGFNYGPADRALQEEADLERYGTFRDEARQSRDTAMGMVDSGIRQAANSPTLGLADIASAGIDAAFTDRDFRTALQRQRALTEADYEVNPVAAWTGTILGGARLPTRAFQSGQAARDAALATGLGNRGAQGAREAAAIGRRAGARRFAGESAAYGGAQGVIGNIENPSDAVTQGAAGAVAGAALGYPLGRTIGAAVRPEARALMDEGIRPTMGQMAGGLTQRIEDVVARTPLAGATVSGAQRRAAADLNRAQINRALRPLGENLPRNVSIGHEGIDYARTRLNQVYESELPNISGNMPQTFPRRLAAVARRANIPQGTDGERNVQAAVTEAMRPFRNGSFNGRAWKTTDESLGDLSRSWSSSDDPYVRQAGRATRAMRDQLRRVVYNQNPQAATRLRQADRGYASLIRTEKAALNSPDGIFSPAQLNSAVRQTDNSARRNAVARGRALDQDLSGPAARILGNTAAQGGSSDYNALASLALLGTNAVTGNPVALAGGGILGLNALLYSRPGQALARGAMAGTGVQRGARALVNQSGQPIVEQIEGYFDEEIPVPGAGGRR